MVREGTPSLQSLDRALLLLSAIVEDHGGLTLSRLAGQLDLPPSTAHRMATTFARCGFLRTVGRGHYVVGPELVRLAPHLSLAPALAAAARPILVRLAGETGRVAHLGILEGDMVTYLVKAGRAGEALFTREGMQLEAYCSAIGKILVAALPEAEREAYLANGPFIRLTPNTIVEPERLRAMLEDVREGGLSTDTEEIAEGLCCVAMPVRDCDDRVIAAISLSGDSPLGCSAKDNAALEALRQASWGLTHDLWRHRRPESGK